MWNNSPKQVSQNIDIWLSPFTLREHTHVQTDHLIQFFLPNDNSTLGVMSRIVTFFSSSSLQCDISFISTMYLEHIQQNWMALSLHSTYKNLWAPSLKICSFQKKCPSSFLYHTEHSLLCPCEKISSVEYW